MDITQNWYDGVLVNKGFKLDFQDLGDQLEAALGDFDNVGRVVLDLSQNAAETRLLRNKTEKQGLRVTLAEGPSGNTSGIGSSIRLVYEDDRKGLSC